MTCIVQKYGGSSVADIDKLRKIAGLIADVQKQKINVAVVVSAMGKTTDNLLSMARELSPKPPRREMDMLLSTGERITMALLEPEAVLGEMLAWRTVLCEVQHDIKVQARHGVEQEARTLRMGNPKSNKNRRLRSAAEVDVQR